MCIIIVKSARLFATKPNDALQLMNTIVNRVDDYDSLTACGEVFTMKVKSRLKVFK